MFELYIRIVNWIKEQQAQDLVEYALIAALIAVVCIAAITAGGSAISTIWSKVSSGFADAAAAV